MKRIIFDVVLFLAVFILPWWASLLVLIFGLFAFKNFYEFIVASFIVYYLYAVPGSRLIASPIFFSLVIISFYLIVELIKNRIILYKK